MISPRFLCCALAGAVLSLAPLAPRSASAQTPADSAQHAFDEALEALMVGYERQLEGVVKPPEWDRAIGLFQQAAELYERVGNTIQRARSIYFIGLTYSAAERHDSALLYIKPAAEMFRQAADTLREGIARRAVGDAYRRIRQVDSAFVYYRASRERLEAVGDPLNLAHTNLSLGQTYLATGAPDSAVNHLEAALAEYERLGEAVFEADARLELAAVYTDLHRFEVARNHLERLLAIRRATGDRSGELMAVASYYELASTALGDSLPRVPTLEQMNRYIGDPTVTNAHASLFAYMADVYGIFTEEEWRGTRDKDHSPEAYRAILAFARQIGDRSAEGEALFSLGLAFAAEGVADSALAYYADALTIQREIDDRFREGWTLFSIGIVHHRIRHPPDLSSALAYYDTAAAARSSLVRRAGADESRVSFAEVDVALFGEWALAWLAHEADEGVHGAELAALAVSDRGRAQGLLDLMRGSETAPRQGPAVGADLPEEGRRLAEGVASTGTPVLYYAMARDTLLVWLLEPTGQVVLSRAAVTWDSVAELVASLRQGLGAGEAAGETQLLAAETGAGDAGLEAATGLEEGDPADRTRGLEDEEGSDAAVAEAAGRLSDLLLPESLRGDLPSEGELAVVPQGLLAMVPFAMLPLGEGEPLAARLAVRSAPSLSALLDATERSGAPGPPPAAELRSALVAGNPVMPRVRTTDGLERELASLPGAEAEGRWVADRLGAVSLVGATASETDVRARLPDAPVVHLATHGFAYSAAGRARDSFVALAPDEQNDGLLTVGELMDDASLRLQADLVVLSACQTGLGDLKQAEGTIGLQRAFLAKGARSVLVSLWNVSDEATRLLMERFYTHWLDDPDGPSKAEALRRAQEDVRGTEGFEHPKYWAAFQLVGAN